MAPPRAFDKPIQPPSLDSSVSPPLVPRTSAFSSSTATASELNEQGGRLMERGAYDAAATAYRKAIDLQSTCAAAWANLARLKPVVSCMRKHIATSPRRGCESCRRPSCPRFFEMSAMSRKLAFGSRERLNSLSPKKSRWTRPALRPPAFSFSLIRATTIAS